MATIFTEDLVYAEDFEIEIDTPNIGHDGQDLIFTGGGTEIRINLRDEQLKELVDVLEMHGFLIREDEEKWQRPKEK